jgi:hypothetical protein
MNFHKKLPILTFTHWVSRDRLSSEQTQRGERPARVRGEGVQPRTGSQDG